MEKSFAGLGLLGNPVQSQIVGADPGRQRPGRGLQEGRDQRGRFPGEPVKRHVGHFQHDAVHIGDDIFFSMGTSAVVHPAAALPFEALRTGATMVEINPEPTPLTGKADFVLAGAAGKILPELLSGLRT